MIVIGMVAMDLIPYSLHALFWTQNLALGSLIISAILLSLLVYDFLEVLDKGGKIRLITYASKNA